VGSQPSYRAIRCTVRLATHNALTNAYSPWTWDHILSGAVARQRYGYDAALRHSGCADWDRHLALPLAQSSGAETFWLASTAQFPAHAQTIPPQLSKTLHPGGWVLNKRTDSVLTWRRAIPVTKPLQNPADPKDLDAYHAIPPAERWIAPALSDKGFFKEAWEIPDRTVLVSPTVTFEALCESSEQEALLRDLVAWWSRNGYVGAKSTRGYGRLSPITRWDPPEWISTPWHDPWEAWVWPEAAPTPRRPLPATLLSHPSFHDRIANALAEGRLEWQLWSDRIPGFWGDRQWSLLPPADSWWPRSTQARMPDPATEATDDCDDHNDTEEVSQ